MSTKILYDALLSGHAHRPRALLSLLNIDYETVHVNMAEGEHKTPDFLAMNPLGQVPVFTDGDIILRESTAILVYLASAYDDSRQWLPTNPELAAKIQSWLAISSKEMHEGPNAARLNKLFNAPFDHETAVNNSYSIFDELFEPHLGKNDWLVGNKATIADLANYGYIAAAHEGEVSLENYPNISAWLKRLEALKDFPKMPNAAEIFAGA